MQLDNLGIDYIDRRTSLIEAVTLADTKRVAKRLLDAGLLVTVVGQPEGVTSTGRRVDRGRAATVSEEEAPLLLTTPFACSPRDPRYLTAP